MAVKVDKDVCIGCGACTGFAKGVEDSISVLKKAGYQDITTCIYHNSRHEILNDNDANRVYEDCLTWLDKRN